MAYSKEVMQGNARRCRQMVSMAQRYMALTGDNVSGVAGTIGLPENTLRAWILGHSKGVKKTQKNLEAMKQMKELLRMAETEKGAVNAHPKPGSVMFVDHPPKAEAEGKIVHMVHTKRRLHGFALAYAAGVATGFGVMSAVAAAFN
jgi:hypothetical protein